MPVIKRYANRKLYDTETKRYVTLEDLAEFVRQGEDVSVVDHATGEDLTSQTLLQVVFEEEKKIGGLLPQVFLTRLIRAGSSTVSALRSRLLALDPFQTVDEEIRRRLQSLVEQGLLSDEESQRMQNLLIYHSLRPGAVHIPVQNAEEEDAAASVEVDAPVLEEGDRIDPQELEALLRQVDALEQELQRLQNK